MKTNLFYRQRLLGVLSAAAIVLGLLAPAPAHLAQAAGNPNPGVLPPNSHPYGHSYAEWNNRWWQWAFSIPAPPDNPAFNPLFDETGSNCGRDQSGPVFYLVGVFNISGTATRNDCVVPAGKALFFPVLNVEWDTADGTPVGELRNIVRAGSLCHDQLTMGTKILDFIDVFARGML
jgi:hypothetical protein